MAYAVLVEIYRGYGESLQGALDKTAYWREGGAEDSTPTADVPAVSEDAQARQNAEEFAKLEEMLKGVKK